MITYDRLPKTGQLIVAINFKGYDEYYANETRLTLLGLSNRKDVKEVALDLYPLDYWLKRTVISKVDEEQKDIRRKPRATGGLFRIGFMGMTPEKFRKLSEILTKMKKTYWDDIELLVADQVGEL